MAEVRVKFRHLDTDDHSFERIPIDRVPDNPMRQEQLLVETVQELQPRARHKSFADGVASFVGPEHLIVAFFASETTVAASPRAPAEADDPGEQDQLFAA